ncbi:MAG: HlyD family secretion protein [Phyllobacteriaceae bacterium]|nr:HlyD family secretion protein [Phyllobacteriaceae bacterium]
MARSETTPGTGGTPHVPPPQTVAPAAAAELSAPPPARRGAGRKRLVLAAVALSALGFAGWKGWDWFTVGRFMVSTDDAYVKAETVTIAPRTSGFVTEVRVADLQRVKRGDVLAVVDPGDGELAVKAAESKLATQDATLARIDAQIVAGRAAITQAEATLASARADVARTEADFARAQALVKTPAGTQQALDTARAARDRTAAGVDVAEAGVVAARAGLTVVEGQRREAAAQRDELAVALDKARRDLSFTEVRAPFDGVVGNKAVQVGMYVAPGTRLLALVPLDEVYVEANYKETQVGEIRPGARAFVTVDGLPGRRIEGRVVGLSPATGAQFSLLPPENATGNFTKIVQRLPVRIAVPAEVAREGALRAGLSVEAEIDTRTGEK